MSNSNDDILNDTITISSSGSSYSAGTYTISVPVPVDTITLNSTIIGGAGTSYYTGAGMAGASGTSYTVSNGAVGTTIGSIDLNSSTFSWINPTPFKDGFPEWHDFQDMTKAYPGLEKAYENLKVIYKMCKDDWDSQKKGSK